MKSAFLLKTKLFRFFVACLLLPSVACFTLHPTGVQKQKLRVLSQPSGTMIWLEDEQGRRQLGQTPGEFELEHQVGTKDFNHLLWLVALAPIAALAGGVGWNSHKSYDFSGNDGSFVWAYYQYGLIGIGAAGLVSALVACTMGEIKSGREQVEELTLVAENTDYEPKFVSVSFPYPDEQLEIELLKRAQTYPAPWMAPIIQVPTFAAPAPSKPVRKGPKTIVAVFDVHDPTGLFDKPTLLQLTTYLSTALTQYAGFSVIPRDQLRSRLLDQKKETYKDCFAESCQIELGRALAAQKSLATQLLKVGSKCAVSANLLDLKTETIDKGALVETSCSADDLMEAMKKVANQFSESQ